MTPNFWFGSIFGWLDAVVCGGIIVLLALGFLADAGTCLIMDIFERKPKKYRGTFSTFETQDKDPKP